MIKNEHSVFDPTIGLDDRVPLGTGITVRISLDGQTVEAALEILAPKAQPGARSPKALVAAVAFTNDMGLGVPAPDGWYTSPRFGAFRYLSGDGTVTMSISPPKSAKAVDLTLAPWAMPAEGVTVKNAVRIERPQTYDRPDLRLDEVLPVPSVVDLAPGRTEEWVTLRSTTPPVLLPVIGGQDLLLDVRMLRNVESPAPVDRPRALVNIEWVDAEGRTLPSRGHISSNQNFGEYRYVRLANGRPNRLLLQPPLTATRGILSLRRWNGTPGEVSFQRQAVVTFRGLQGRTKIQSGPARRVEKIRVAMVCDEFTYNSFEPECELLPLTPDGWREELQAFKPDLFLCESAWAGPDSAARPWRGRVYASVNFPRENRTELFGIIEYCREAGIPTAFWNKEDPSHYEDRRHDFVRTALLFDHIFTTALECVERYKVDYGHPSVHCLPFATQPRHFNPMTSEPRTDEVIFAGSWYNQHPARGKAMSQIFDAVVDSGRELVIYNRHHGDDDPNHQFPEEYASRLRPAVTHLEMARLYKRSHIGLNINTETASKTMFARRVFELMSSNTLVLSNYSAGMEEMFGDSVVFVDRDPDRVACLTDIEVDTMRQRALREVLMHHTYRNRFVQILDAVGIPHVSTDDRPALATVVTNAEGAEAAIRAFAFLASAADGLVLVLDESIPPIEVRGYYRRFNRGRVRVVDRRLIGGGEGLGLDLAFDRIVLTDDIERLTADMLMDVRLHATYMDEPMTFADSPERRYAVVSGQSESATHRIVRQADLGPELVGAGDRKPAYYAI